MPSSKTDWVAFTVPQLEAFVNARSQVIESLHIEMAEIQEAISVKNAHYIEVERFAGMTAEEIAAFHSLRQGISSSDVSQFQGI